jgi:hypothetical protein
MIIMAADKPRKWRNFASWCAAGGLIVVVAMGIGSWLRHGDPLHALLAPRINPAVVLALLASMLVVGLSSRNTAFDWRTFRNFAVASAVTGIIALLAIAGFTALARTGRFGTMGASQWAAGGVGLALLVFGGLLGFFLAAAARGWTVMDVDQVETIRERSRLLVLSATTMVAMGLALILLSLAGPGSVVSPAAALAVLLVLSAVTAWLSIAAWRLMDELDRTLSYETGNMAFCLAALLGGGWAVLAHLGLFAAAAPLDWLTMFTLVAFVASFIATGRRKLLTR